MIISKNAPYQSSHVDPEITQIKINKLLKSYGVDQVQWNADFKNNRVAISILVEAEINGVKRPIKITIEPPLFIRRAKQYNPMLGKQETISAPNWSASFRLLFWYLKAKLEAISYGLTSVEKEFLSQVMVSLPNGGETTIYQKLIDSGMAKGLQITDQGSPQIIEAQIVGEH